MKTTVEIAHALLEEAQAAAAREGTTLRALVNEGLRRMIAIDTNLLVYAHREDSPWHDAARERVAALGRHHASAELWAADRDFGRLPGFTVRNPLVD